MENEECYWLSLVFGNGSLGKSSRVCSVLCVRFRSSVETNTATADTRCTKPRHGVTSTPCDRLVRDMLEALGSALYRRLKGLGSLDPARSPTITYKKCWYCGSVFCVLCGRPPGQHAGRAPSPKEESRVGGGALLPRSTSWLRLFISASRATTTSRPPPLVARAMVEREGGLPGSELDSKDGVVAGGNPMCDQDQE